MGPSTRAGRNRRQPTRSALVSHSPFTVASGVYPGGVNGLGNNGDPVVINRKEAAVDRGRMDLTRHGLDSNVTTDQDPQQRRMARQDTQLALHGARIDLLGFALPDLAICGDELDIQLTHKFLFSRTSSAILTGTNR